MREVLTVRVRIKETYEVHGQRGLARMILFDGEGEGSGFYGKILPGGVDTQQVHDDGKARTFRTVYARGNRWFWKIMPSIYRECGYCK